MLARTARAGPRPSTGRGPARTTKRPSADRAAALLHHRPRPSSLVAHASGPPTPPGAGGSEEPSAAPARPPPPPPPTSSSATPSGGPLAVGAVAVGAAAFIAARLVSAAAGGSLADVAAGSVPLAAALASGRPTVVEFYADYCEVCKESAPEALAAQRVASTASVNYVLLNVDNAKWAPEVAEYGVRGVPTWVFLDGGGGLVGSATGRLPPGGLAADVSALGEGGGARLLPMAGASGEVTPLRAVAPGGGGGGGIAPRAHG